MKQLTTHAPIPPTSIVSGWSITSGGTDKAPEAKALLTLRQLSPAKGEAQRTLTEAKLVLTPAGLRALIDQLEDHASNIEPEPAKPKSKGGTINGTLREAVSITIEGAADPADIARAQANVNRLRNGGAL